MAEDVLMALRTIECMLVLRCASQWQQYLTALSTCGLRSPEVEAQTQPLFNLLNFELSRGSERGAEAAMIGTHLTQHPHA